MKLVAAFLLAAVPLGAHAFAGTFTAPNGTVHSGAYYVAPGSAWSGGKTNLVGTVAGLAAGATLNTSVGFASNAASVIAMAAFASGTPAGLGVGVLAWLAAQGLAYSDAASHASDGSAVPGWTRTKTVLVDMTVWRSPDDGPCGSASAGCGSPQEAATSSPVMKTLKNISVIGVTCPNDTNCTVHFDAVSTFDNYHWTDYTVNVTGAKGQGSRDETKPAVEDDFQHVQPQIQLSPTDPATTLAPFDDALRDSPVPIPVVAPDIDAFSPDGEPYPCKSQPSGDCVDGFKVKTDPSNAPVGVVVTPVTRDATDKSGTPADPTPTTGGDSTDEPDKSDLCKLHPDSLACTTRGDPPDGDPTWQTKSVDYAADDLGLPSSCPAPHSFEAHGIAFTLNYGALCNVAGTVRTGLLALTALSCLFFIVKVTRGG